MRVLLLAVSPVLTHEVGACSKIWRVMMRHARSSPYGWLIDFVVLRRL